MDVTEQETELKALVADILAEAEKQGADQCEVSVSSDEGLSVNVRKGELEQVEFNQDRGFGITVYFGQRKGSASTTDSSRAAIENTVAAASNIARFTEEDPCNGLADASLMQTEVIDLDLFHPWTLEPDVATDLACACEGAGLEMDDRLTNSDGASVNTQQSVRVYGNSHGFLGSYIATRHGMSCVLIGEDESGMQRDYWYSVGRNQEDLDAAEDIGREAARRTLARLSPRKASTGTYPVLFAPPMAAGLIGHVIGAISGGALYRNASFLIDSMGKQIMPDWLSLVERPQLPGQLGSAYFDSDGLATHEKAFVDSGVVASYVLSSYSARKLGLEPTGNAGGVFNLDLDGTARDPAELLSGMGTGLYVTELMGQGVNTVTGDYSRGAAGFWVEDGQIAYPVAEATIAGNLSDMLMNITGIGTDVDYRGNIRAPSILVSEMTVAGDGSG